jgi:hypothetical protein
MKMTSPAKLFTGLGLMASLFWGCQDLLSQKDSAADPSETVDETALSLSIKDDPVCREQWSAILEARTGGHPDSGAEAAFLAGCVKEIKVGKDKVPPVIPRDLLPDSTSRCHWIVAQIEGGRDEMTVSYKRYCPDDCRKLEDGDSTRHVRLCRDSSSDTTKVPRDTIKNPRDTIKVPPDTIPNPRNSAECFNLRIKLSSVKPGEPGYAELEKMYIVRCNDTLPHNPEQDTCKMIRTRIAGLDSNSEEALKWRRILLERCGKPPIDTVKPPRPDTTECFALKMKLSMVKPGEPGYADLERMFKARCLDSLPKPPKDTIVKPPLPKDTLPKPPLNECEGIMKKLMSVPVGGPDYMYLKDMYNRVCVVRDTTVKPPIVKDTLPKPLPVTTPADCEGLRAKLLTLDPASADYKRLVGSIREHCPEVKPTVE